MAATGTVCVGVIPPLGVASGSSCGDQLVGSLPAVGGPLGEAAHHHRLERG